MTIIDELPFEIDESESTLNGGKYDSKTKTITWEETIENIDTFSEENNGKVTDTGKYSQEDYNINIIKNITIKYKDLKYTLSNNKITNSAKGIIELITTGDKKEATDNHIVSIRIPKFNFSIEKNVISATIDGKESIISNGKLGKIEIYRKNLDTSIVKIKYKITITNTEELEGIAKVVENIPNGFSYLLEDNAGWIEEDGKLIQKVNLASKESKDLYITLIWNKGEENLGTFKNIVYVEGQNDMDVKEESLEDNQDEADVILTVSTGMERVVIYSILGSLTCVGLAIIVKKKI